MASILLGSFPIASSVTAFGSCSRSTKCAKGYYANSYVTKASWYKTEKIQNEYLIVKHQHYLKDRNKGIGAGSTREECGRSYVVNAAPEELAFESEPQGPIPTSTSFWGSNIYSLDAFSRFVRPYAMIGTVISTISVSLVAVEKLSDISPTFFIAILKVMAVYFPMLIYINGINQLADLEIDKINKPNLPLVSGEYSFTTGVIITVASCIMSFGLAWIIGSPPLFWATLCHFILTSAYSINLPLLRWKRSTELTAINFAVDRAIIYQLALFLHMQTYVFKRPIMFPRSLFFSIVFSSIGAIVIALFKDIPDMEGDEKFGIRSLAVRLGPKRVFWFCVSLLEIGYGVAILVGATSSNLWSKLITILGHALLASILWYRAKSVDLNSKTATQSFYLFIWKLLSVEFILVPLFR